MSVDEGVAGVLVVHRQVEGVNTRASIVGKVVAEVIKSVGGEKVSITKFRRRKHHQKVTGHRQWYTQVKITGINA